MNVKALELDPATLRPNPWNPNSCSPENEAKLEQSIRKHGLFKPVIVRETDEGYEILGGEHRATIAARIGLPSVPVFSLGRIPESKAKEIGLLDNARYGTDDAESLAEILSELGSAHDLSLIMPYSEEDFRAILATTDIALDELGLDDDLDEKPANRDEAAPKAPKTHTMMRFKVTLADAERITERVAKTAKRQGFTLADDLTNAGDALVHLLLSDDQSALIDEAE